MDNTEGIINNGENGVSGDISADNLGFLELLLTDKVDKIREYEKAQIYIQELIISESNEPQKFKSFVKLILRGDLQIVKGFFEQEWLNLSPENKDLAINELLALSTEKGLTKQSTVAQTIAAKNPEIAAQIIFHILLGSKQNSSDYDYSKIAKEKKDALRFRFFPQNGTWIPLTSSNNQIFRTLVLFFAELTQEVKDFGKQTKQKPSIRLELETAYWIKDSLEKINFDNDSLVKIESLLSRIISCLPEPVRQQLKQKNKTPENPVKIKENDSISPENSYKTETSQKQSSEISKNSPPINEFTKRSEKPIESKTHEPKVTETVQKKDSQKISDLSAPEQLLKEKQNALSQLALEIDVLSKLIDERDSLLTKQKSLENRLSSVYDENDKLETKLRNLRKNFDETEVTLSNVTNERDKALNLQKQLSDELAEARKQLEKATKSLESERSEFAQSSKHEVGFKIENFKGELRQKLLPIFENKRQTDEVPNDEKLAEFLRETFAELESVLNKLGINP